MLELEYNKNQINQFIIGFDLTVEEKANYQCDISLLSIYSWDNIDYIDSITIGDNTSFENNIISGELTIITNQSINDSFILTITFLYNDEENNINKTISQQIQMNSISQNIILDQFEIIPSNILIDSNTTEITENIQFTLLSSTTGNYIPNIKYASINSYVSEDYSDYIVTSIMGLPQIEYNEEENKFIGSFDIKIISNSIEPINSDNAVYIVFNYSDRDVATETQSSIDTNIETPIVLNIERDIIDNWSYDIEGSINASEEQVKDGTKQLEDITIKITPKLIDQNIPDYIKGNLNNVFDLYNTVLQLDDNINSIFNSISITNTFYDISSDTIEYTISSSIYLSNISENEGNIQLLIPIKNSENNMTVEIPYNINITVPVLEGSVDLTKFYWNKFGENNSYNILSYMGDNSRVETADFTMNLTSTGLESLNNSDITKYTSISLGYTTFTVKNAFLSNQTITGQIDMNIPIINDISQKNYNMEITFTPPPNINSDSIYFIKALIIDVAYKDLTMNIEEYSIDINSNDFNKIESDYFEYTYSKEYIIQVNFENINDFISGSKEWYGINYSINKISSTNNINIKAIINTFSIDKTDGIGIMNITYHIYTNKDYGDKPQNINGSYTFEPIIVIKDSLTCKHRASQDNNITININ